MTANYTLNVDTGTVTANTQDLLTDVQNEWEAIYGASLDVDASTPQGTLIQNETVARTSVMKNNADMANTINPNQSYQVFLGSICSLLGIEPTVNKSTIGTDILFTNSGTTTITIPSGNRVQTPDGDYYIVSVDTVINGMSTALAQIQSQEPGPIPLPVGVLTIIDGVIGWGAAEVTITSTINLGTLQLTDAQLRTRRNQMLFKQGLGSLGAINANLLAVDNVTSSQAVENNTGAAGLINGITFTLPSAMYVCVSGAASDQDIANALYDAHGAGCPWDYGAAGEGVPVESPNGVQVIDQYNNKPYYVKFNRPIEFDCYVHITAKQGTSAASEISIQNAIISYSQGNIDGQEGLATGVDVSGFAISSAVITTLPGIIISESTICVLPVGSAAPIWPTGFVQYFSMLPYQEATIKVGNIQVALS